MDLNCRRHSGFSLLPLNSWEWVRSLGRSICSACSRTCGSDAAAALCSLISLSHHCAHKHPAPACTRSSSKTQLRLCILHFVLTFKNISHKYKEIILLLDFLATELAEVFPPSPHVKKHHKSMRLFCCLCRASWKGWSWSCPPPGPGFSAGLSLPGSARGQHALLGQGLAALVLLQPRVIQVASVAVLGGAGLAPGRPRAPDTHAGSALRAGAVQPPRDPGPGSGHAPAANGKGKSVTMQTRENASSKRESLGKKLR